MKKIVVIGAGIGGLAAALSLCRDGHDVTVIEAHIYPGGCAGTFYHQGYRFDAGATLAGGFYPGGPMDVLASLGGIPKWPVRSESIVMQVHLPGNIHIPVTGDETRWEIRRDIFGTEATPFWKWQENTADALWELAMQQPSWPPQTAAQLKKLAGTAFGWIARNPGQRLNPEFLRSAIEPVAARLKNAPASLKQFVDAQLLISAQTTSQHAIGFYGAAALDLPRRGVAHIQGGVGAIANQMVEAIRKLGGKVYFRQPATRIVREKGLPVAVETRRKESFPADTVIANLPPWNIRTLLDDPLPGSLKSMTASPMEGWGAFTLYLGVDEEIIPAGLGLHHQVVMGEPLGEGNSIFLSISPEWDLSRAPRGRRAITISTHTRLNDWWLLYEKDKGLYVRQKDRYQQQVLNAARQVLPALDETNSLVLSGTPVTFNRFTRRTRGWVGGFPQTSLFRAWGPRLAPGIFMVGDSIFPGQSIAATALGGLRVARELGDPAW